jgi:hypothetical protein
MVCAMDATKIIDRGQNGKTERRYTATGYGIAAFDLDLEWRERIRRPMYAVALLTASLYTAFLDVFDYYGSIIRATG